MVMNFVLKKKIFGLSDHKKIWEIWQNLERIIRRFRTGNN